MKIIHWIAWTIICTANYSLSFLGYANKVKSSEILINGA